MFPEHSKQGYIAAGRMGAGIYVRKAFYVQTWELMMCHRYY